MQLRRIAAETDRSEILICLARGIRLCVMEKRWDRRAEWIHLFPRFFAGGPIFDFSKQYK